MKKRNRAVYRELEKRSELLEEMTTYVQPLIAEVEALRAENSRLRDGLLDIGIAVDTLTTGGTVTLD